ncbi:MAG: hypothetical protein EOO41_02755 [Methanobacteriota archaeon]|nr:MAG: hypothetical protein EOO41_02755 [Euryarchaeota archaeon]
MAAAGAGGMMAMDDAMLEAAAAELGLPPREMTPSGLGMMAPGVAPSAPSAPGVDVKTVKTWTALYPTYFNPDIPLSKGRRLAKEALAGCRDPWPQDVAEAAVRLGFANVALEVRAHAPGSTRDSPPA